MRASWGTGFRAPTLPDLHTQQFTSIANFLEDPVRCPVTGQRRGLRRREFPTIFGGNPT